MRTMTTCGIALLLIGCGRPADKPADATVGEAPAMEQEAPAGISLADLAGTWNVRAALDGSDKTITYDLATTEDGSGTLTFPGRDPIPLRVVATEGDSIMWEAGPFESAIRKGVQVRVARTVARLQDGKMVGNTTAIYEGQGADSVATLTMEGTRAP